MKLKQDAGEAAYLAKLLFGALALGAFLGGLGWLHFILFDSQNLPLPRIVLGAWTILTCRCPELRAEFLLSAGAGALALGLPVVLLIFKKGKGK